MRSLTRWLNAGLIAWLILGFLPALPYLAPAGRGWTARAIWAALDQYQRVDRVP